MPFGIIMALNVTTDNCVLKACGCCTIKPTFTAVLVMYYILILNAWCNVQSNLSVSLFCLKWQLFLTMAAAPRLQ